MIRHLLDEFCMCDLMEYAVLRIGRCKRVCEAAIGLRRYARDAVRHIAHHHAAFHGQRFPFAACGAVMGHP
ncbi:MAG: hypothetical protein IPI07_16035 [Flavobacteriales bacterium]|nr:hypothetical protein [Flavobacteriales bacterium]MBK7754261.1 hypothetical protein [Flavobacteriales bacterium]